MLCFVLILWILVFTLSFCVGRHNVQQDGFIRQLHFTTQTQHQVQSSSLLDAVVRLCPVIVHSICIPNYCILLIEKMGLFSLQSPNVSFKMISSSPVFVVVVMTNFIRMLMRNVFVFFFLDMKHLRTVLRDVQ